MRRTEQDAWIVLENILRPVAVMHIPINDGDALGTVAALRMAGRNRNIVEKAKAHSRGALGMMSGRAGSNEDIICSAGKHVIDRRRCRTDSRQRGIQAFGTDIGIAVELDYRGGQLPRPKRAPVFRREWLPDVLPDA